MVNVLSIQPAIFEQLLYKLEMGKSNVQLLDIEIPKSSKWKGNYVH